MRRAMVVLGCLSPLVLGSAWYAATADATLPIVRFELAGDATGAARVVGGATADYREALAADYPFMAGYALTLCAACLLGLRRTTGRRARLMLGFAAVAGPLAAAFDLVENLNLAHGLTTMSDAAFGTAAAFATAKFLLLAVAMPIGIGALVLVARTPVPAEPAVPAGR